ncbi:MAG: hypothetical protein U9R37_05980 [Campylobacterota bacterium]|nr:hypothetical protein [Campylobacterota bacterium]
MKELIFTIIITTFLYSNNSVGERTQEEIIEKQIEIEMEKEKKYAIEQTFYNYQNYDFKGSEVSKDSLENIPDLEIDELDMDSVYD